MLPAYAKSTSAMRQATAAHRALDGVSASGRGAWASDVDIAASCRSGDVMARGPLWPPWRSAGRAQRPFRLGPLEEDVLVAGRQGEGRIVFLQGLGKPAGACQGKPTTGMRPRRPGR